VRYNNSWVSELQSPWTNNVNAWTNTNSGSSIQLLNTYLNSNGLFITQSGKNYDVSVSAGAIRVNADATNYITVGSTNFFETVVNSASGMFQSYVSSKVYTGLGGGFSIVSPPTAVLDVNGDICFGTQSALSLSNTGTAKVAMQSARAYISENGSAFSLIT
jgi:hypothetical protein